MVRAGSRLLVLGSGIFLGGAAIGVPSLFMTSDQMVRLNLLAAHATRWRIAQVPYAIGPLVAAFGVVLISGAWEGNARRAVALSGVALVVGSIAWAYSCWLRGRYPTAFAEGSLPGWPFTTYVVLTLVVLAVAGLTGIVSGRHAVLGWAVLSWDVAFTAAYVITHDIPPFVFYLLMLGVGFALW